MKEYLVGTPSTFCKILNSSHCRDAKHITFCADNFAAQNKTWILYTALVMEINRKPGSGVSDDTITIKYFESGHTFNAAASFHRICEQEFTKRKNVYDFDDLISVVNFKGIAIPMVTNDFK